MCTIRKPSRRRWAKVIGFAAAVTLAAASLAWAASGDSSGSGSPAGDPVLEVLESEESDPDSNDHFIAACHLITPAGEPLEGMGEVTFRSLAEAALDSSGGPMPAAAAGSGDGAEPPALNFEEMGEADLAAALLHGLPGDLQGQLVVLNQPVLHIDDEAGGLSGAQRCLIVAQRLNEVLEIPPHVVQALMENGDPVPAEADAGSTPVAVAARHEAAPGEGDEAEDAARPGPDGEEDDESSGRGADEDGAAPEDDPDEWSALVREALEPVDLPEITPDLRDGLGVVMAGDELLITATPAAAAANRTSPAVLAWTWANEFREAVGLAPLPLGYAPVDKARLQTMRASWYGEKFHNGPTASGETYDMFSMTAAHRTLPFGTMLRIIDPATGGQTIVRINNRGPYIMSRHIDLSYAAADAVNMVSRGVADLWVETLYVPGQN